MKFKAREFGQAHQESLMREASEILIYMPGQEEPAFKISICGDDNDQLEIRLFDDCFKKMVHVAGWENFNSFMVVDTINEN